MRKLLAIVSLGSLGLGMSTVAYAEQNPPPRTTIVAPSPAPHVSTTYTQMNPNNPAANNGSPTTTSSTPANPTPTTSSLAPATTNMLPNGGTIPGPNNFILAVGGTGSNVATITNTAGQNVAQGYGGSAAIALNPQPKEGDILLITVTDPQNTSTCHIRITSEQNGGYAYDDTQYEKDSCSQLLPPVSMTNQPNSFTINPGEAVASTPRVAVIIPTNGVAPANTTMAASTTAAVSSKFSLTVTGNASDSATVQTMSGRILATANPTSGAQGLAGPINSGDILLVTVSNGMNIDNCHIQIIDADNGGYTYTDGQFPNDTCSSFLPATSSTAQTGMFVINTSQPISN